MVVTDTHLLVCTDTETHAIEVLSGESEWSYPATGHLALADETLFVAAADGVLTAISMPEHTLAPPAELQIEGPTAVQEWTTASFEVWVTYADGRVRRRTQFSEWSVAPQDYASIDASGELSVTEMLQPEQRVVVGARYREHEIEIEGALEVTLGISVSLDDFVRRNVEAALSAKRSALGALAEAQRHELAALRAVQQQIPPGPPGPWSLLRQTLNRLWRAMFWGVFGQHAVQNGAAALEEELAEASAPGASHPRHGRTGGNRP
jgi:hypothetical protein